MKIIRASAAFSFATLISRIAGFLRDAGIAYFFGSSIVSDAFFIAFRIPNTLRRIIGEGGFNAVFIPLYSQSLKEGDEFSFLSRVFSLYMVFTLLITLLGILFASYIILLLAPGFANTEAYSLAVYMTRWLFLYLPFIALSSYFMGILNTRKRFFVPAFSQAVFNSVMLISLILFAERFGYTSLIVGVLTGGIFQVLIYFPAIAKLKVKFSISFEIDEKIKTLGRRLLPSIAGYGITQISFFVDTILASFIGTGAISYIYYANRIFQLPLGVFSVGVANSLLSFVAIQEGKREENVKLTSRLIFLLIIPSSAGLFVLSLPIVKTIYGRGKFEFEDAVITSSLLSIYSMSLIFFSLQKLVASLFFAKGDTLTPMKTTAVYVISEAFFSVMYAFILKLSIYGLSLGTLSASIISFVYIYMRSSDKFLWDIKDTVVKSILSSFFMVLFIKLISINYSMSYLTQVFFLIPLGAFVYWLSLLILRERMILDLIKGRVIK